jgi:hypothetical protein
MLPQHREQPQSLVALRTWGSRQHEQRLRLILGEEHLAVHLDRARFGMDERLVVLEALRDLVLFTNAANSSLTFCSARTRSPARDWGPTDPYAARRFATWARLCRPRSASG